jgi:F-type H+-transporting ATPase subunit epsilon
MRAEIVSPEKMLFEGDAEMVVCQTTNGEIAFLEGHEPFLGMLSAGKIRVVNDGEEYSFTCTRGFVEVDGAHVRVISDDAVAE